MKFVTERCTIICASRWVSYPVNYNCTNVEGFSQDTKEVGLALNQVDKTQRRTGQFCKRRQWCWCGIATTECLQPEFPALECRSQLLPNPAQLHYQNKHNSQTEIIRTHKNSSSTNRIRRLSIDFQGIRFDKEVPTYLSKLRPIVPRILMEGKANILEWICSAPGTLCRDEFGSEWHQSAVHTGGCIQMHSNAS